MSSYELFEEAVNTWNKNNGQGTIFVPKRFDDKALILLTLQKLYSYKKDYRCLILVSDFAERQSLITYLTNQGDEENDKEFKQLIADKTIKLFTYDFFENNTRNGCDILIVYHVKTVTSKLELSFRWFSYKMVVLNEHLDNENAVKLNKISKVLDTFRQKDVSINRVSTPVEEYQIAVNIPTDSKVYELLQYYTTYITTSINIFGSFDIMNQARTGNAGLNISANQICLNIAQENGWNPNLDMSVEFNVEIDKIYNPNNLRDRASKTYEIIRERSKLLSNYEPKLDKLLEIVKENKDKKILVINKRGEFANKVTTFLNTMFETDICGNYHDKVENVPAVDADGTPIFYKSGLRKGERKYIGAKAQKTLNETLFNMGKLNVLSTNNAVDKDLQVNVDIIVITSPQCEDIKSYQYRLDKVVYNDKITLYSIYCAGTLEEKLLENKQLSQNHKILNNDKKVTINSENSDFIIVD